MSGKSVTKQGISGLLWNFSGSIFQIVFQFIVIGVLARLLTPEEFGIVGVILIFVNFSKRFIDLGVSTALIQLKYISKKHIGISYTISTLLGILIGILFYLIAPLISDFFGLKDSVNNGIQFFALFFPFLGFNSVTIALLTRNLRYSLLVKVSIVAYLLGSGLTAITLAYLNFSYWALIIGQFVTLLISVFTLIYFQKPIFNLHFDKKVTSELLIFGSGHTLNVIFSYLGDNADNIISGKILGTISLGLYSKAYQLYSIPASFFGKMFNKVLFPILSKKQNDSKKLARFYVFTTSLCFGILIPISAIFLVNAELIVSVILGDQWKEAILIFQILIFGLAYRFGIRINKSYLTALGIIFKGAYYQAIYAIFMFIFCFIGVTYFGLPGVAIGVLSATILNYVQTSSRVLKEVNYASKSLLRIHIKTFVFFSIILGSMLIFDFLLVKSMWVHLLITILLFLPLTLVFIFRRNNIIFTEENTPMINQIMDSLPKKLLMILKQIKPLKKHIK